MLTLKDIAKAVAAHDSIDVALSDDGLVVTLTYRDVKVYAARTSADTEALRSVAGHVLVAAESHQPARTSVDDPPHVVTLRFALAPPKSDAKSKDA